MGESTENVVEGVARLQLVDKETIEHDEEEEEEEEEEPIVVLGFVQNAQHAWSLSRHHFPSKAGGTPAWLDPIHLPQGDEILCGVCGKPLQLLMQVYAPIEGKAEAFHRTLYVFMCPNMSCLQKHRENQLQGFQEKSIHSVKVFRCQLPRVNEFYSKDPPKNNGIDSSVAQGVPLCSWCGTWKGEKVCGGCKKARYCVRQHQVEHWKSSHADVCKSQAANMEAGGKNEGKMVTKVEASTPAFKKLWQEFEIVDEEEGSEESSASPGSMAVIGSGKEDDISREFQEPSLEQQQWVRFQARLARAPGQVLRYCRSVDAKPLWPHLDERPETSIPDCPACKGQRIFEFQVLPQLLYYFKVSNEPDALDWGTLAVYTCESSCTSSNIYTEEFVWVQSAF